MTKEDLEAALVLHKEIERKRGRLRDLRETGGVGSASGKEAISGGTGKGTGQLAVELDEDIQRLEKQLVLEREIVRRRVYDLDIEGIQEQLLILRYVDCREWWYIRKRISYSRSHTFQLHQDVLKQTIRLYRT